MDTFASWKIKKLQKHRRGEHRPMGFQVLALCPCRPRLLGCLASSLGSSHHPLLLLSVFYSFCFHRLLWAGRAVACTPILHPWCWLHLSP